MAHGRELGAHTGPFGWERVLLRIADWHSRNSLPSRPGGEPHGSPKYSICAMTIFQSVTIECCRLLSRVPRSPAADREAAPSVPRNSPSHQEATSRILLESSS